MNRTIFTAKIQFNPFDSDRFICQDDHFNDTEDDSGTRSNKVDNSEYESHGEVDSPHQLDYMKLNPMFHQENQILLTVGSSQSTSVSVNKYTKITSRSTFLQGLFL